MAGLSDLITNTASQSTSMPPWYDAAQQAVVNKATTASGQMPALGQTVAGQAIGNLSGAQNPFMQAQGTLGQIGQGAANPWITDPTTGQVSPDTSTAMGGLFQAQNQQLNQLLPSATAPVEGANIAGGNFGSLRGLTAVDKAKGDAFANLNDAQMQDALQNQQTGVQAGTALGNVGSQGTTSMLGLGQAQQSDPFMAASNLGKIVGGIQAPTTVTNTTQLSPLNTLGSLATAGSAGYSALDSMIKNAGVTGGLGGILKSIMPGSSSGSGSGITLGANGMPTAGTYSLADGSSMTINTDGSKTITGTDGTPKYFDAKGNAVSSDQGLQNSNVIPDSSTTQQSSNASDTSSLDQLVSDTQVQE